MSFDMKSLITDRTIQDVTNKTVKGQYRASDLNRICKAINYVAERLQALGHNIQTTQKNNWSYREWLNVEQGKFLLLDLSKLRNEIVLFVSTPNVPSTMDRLSYSQANDIEKILVDLDSMISQAWVTLRRANAPGFYAGATSLPTEDKFEGRTWKELSKLDLTWTDWDNASFFQLLHGAFGLRTWIDVDALELTWRDWANLTFLELSYEKF